MAGFPGSVRHGYRGGGVYKPQYTPSEYSEQSHLAILSHINKEEQYATWQTYD
uniref:Uncharacterized protein n=1 Tax=virus sp. ctEfN2 TaxID=2825810 RepID=A0A8S5RN58_9VIRU|nr:MAG TPA: hypothetical protein [virus sp. ctEfN2]